MEECLSRLMLERGLNRTSVIRLALYALDCLTRRRELARLSLVELVEELEALAPEGCKSFDDFIRGSGGSATASTCVGWILPDAGQTTPTR